MPKIFSEKNIQAKVIHKMASLCDYDGALKVWDPLSQRKASIQISEELKLLEISQRTIRRWYTHWLAFKRLPCETPTKVCLDHLETFRNWSKADLKMLKDLVDSQPLLFVDEIKDIMSIKLRRELSYSSVYRALTKGLHYSRKVINEKASQAVQKEKDNFVETLKHLMKKPEMAIFIDESNKDRKAARRKYGWSRVGTPVNYRSLFNMDTRYTFIGAADCFGFLIPACDIVTHRYKEKDDHKPVNTERFIEYVKDRLCPILGNYLLGEPHSVVIMDNCSIHTDPEVRRLIEACGARIVYSAPYSPELIPIENMFHQWKTYLRRHHQSFQYDWYAVHSAAIRSVTPQQGLHYFRNTTLVELVENHPLSENYQQKRKKNVLLAVATLLGAAYFFQNELTF
jgi:hypothetical protein